MDSMASDILPLYSSSGIDLTRPSVSARENDAIMPLFLASRALASTRG